MTDAELDDIEARAKVVAASDSDEWTIAKSQDNVPALVAEVRRLRAVIATVHEMDRAELADTDSLHAVPRWPRVTAAP